MMQLLTGKDVRQDLENAVRLLKAVAECGDSKGIDWVAEDGI
jgi:hypothetical protein